MRINEIALSRKKGIKKVGLLAIIPLFLKLKAAQDFPRESGCFSKTIQVQYMVFVQFSKMRALLIVRDLKSLKYRYKSKQFCIYNFRDTNPLAFAIKIGIRDVNTEFRIFH